MTFAFIWTIIEVGGQNETMNNIKIEPPFDGLLSRLLGGDGQDKFYNKNKFVIDFSDVQYGPAITIPIKNMNKEKDVQMKLNTSKHKNEKNLSQDEMEANSRLISSAMSNLLQAYDALSDYRSGLGKETNKNVSRQVREAVEEAYNKLVSGVSLGLLACAKENYPVVKRDMLGDSHVDFHDMGIDIDMAQSISDIEQSVRNLAEATRGIW